MRRILFLAAVPLLLLAGCASTRPSAVATGEAQIATSYGQFLAGEAALNAGRSDEAARFFDQARLAGGDEQGLIAERAFTAALLAGDIDRAAALAPDDAPASEAAKRLGRLVVAVKALADGRGKDAQRLLADPALGFPHRPAAALLAPWAAAAAGDAEHSIARPQVRGDRVVDYFGQLGQAALFERARRYDEAETDFKALTARGSQTQTAILAYGGFLERRGRRAEAVTLYDAALAATPSSVALQKARARAATGAAPPASPSPREGAAEALLAPSAVMIGARQNEIALAYLRLALKLDPKRDEAWVMLGDVMVAVGNQAGAREAYSKPRPGSLEFAAAQAKLAWTYHIAGDKETALKLARAAAASGDPESRLTLADMLRADDRFAESAEILSGLIAESKTPDWRLLYARGVAYERVGRWKEAEADLQAALQLAPEQPELLNYLGYSWIDRGEHLQDALALVQKAVGADPNSGAMVDSLGWAYYRLGDYKQAVEKLEQAVELEAGDPEINNHLGDVYWKVGRKDEALFQWRRVLTLQPTAKIKADAEAKIAAAEGPTKKMAGQ